MASFEIAEFPSDDAARTAPSVDAFSRDDDSFGRSVATREWLAVLAILVLATAIRLGPLQRGLGFDELFTAIHFIRTDTVWQTATTWLTFNNHIAYSLLARLSVGAFGMHEWALRSPALLLGLASLVVLWWLARRIVGPGVALASTALLALSPEHVRWSTSARGYSGLLLGELLLSGCLLALLNRPRWSLVGYLAVATAISSYFHLYAAIVVVVVQGPFLVAMLVRRRADPTRCRGAILGLVGLAAGGLLALLLYLPVMMPLLASIKSGGTGEFRPALAWSVAQEQSAASPDWVVWLVLAGGLGGLAWIWRTAAPIVVYSLALVVVPVLVVILAHPAEQDARFFAYLPPFLLTALAAGGAASVGVLSRWIPGRLRLLAWAPAIVGAGMLLRGWTLVFADFQADEGFRAGVQALESNAPDGTAFCAIGAGAELFQWYASKPLPRPKTINELQEVRRGAAELRCIARPASWETSANAELRHYVEERATAETYGDIVVYRVRRGQ